MKKRMLSWLLSAVMAVTAVPATIYAGEDAPAALEADAKNSLPEMDLFTDGFGEEEPVEEIPEAAAFSDRADALKSQSQAYSNKKISVRTHIKGGTAEDEVTNGNPTQLGATHTITVTPNKGKYVVAGYFAGLKYYNNNPEEHKYSKMKLNKLTEADSGTGAVKFQFKAEECIPVDNDNNYDYIPLYFHCAELPLKRPYLSIDNGQATAPSQDGTVAAVPYTRDLLCGVNPSNLKPTDPQFCYYVTDEADMPYVDWKVLSITDKDGNKAGGTVSFDNNQLTYTPTEAEAGKKITIKIYPTMGFVTDFTEDNVLEVTINVAMAEIDRSTFNISVIAKGGGYAVANPNQAKQGDKISLYLFTDPGYRFKKWQVLTDGITIDPETNTFIMPKSDVKIQPVFEGIPPVLSNGMAVRDSKSTATVKFTSDIAGWYYYAVTGENEEQPEIDTSLNGNGTPYSAGETTISLTNLTPGKKKIYIAAKARGSVSEILQIEIPDFELTPPQNLQWNSDAAGTAKWDAVTNASGYTVQLYKDGTAFGNPIQVTETSCKFKISEAGSYSFGVIAKDENAQYIDSVEAKSGSLHTVTFADAGDIPMMLVADGSKLPRPEPEPKKDHYKFDGWYKDKDTWKVRWDFETDTVTEATTLYARWLYETPPITCYTLSFDTNGGSALSSVTYASGSVVALSGYQPTREGCEFAGWYEDAALTIPVGEVVLNANKTVYAAWTVPGLPDGTMVKPDGSFETPDGVIIRPDGTVELPDGTILTPDAEGNKPVVDKEGNVTAPDGTVYKPDGTIHNTDGSIQDGTGAYLRPGKGMIDYVTVTGNRVNTYLVDEAAGAQGYDYVIGTSADMLKTKDYYQVSKNRLKINTSMYYVEKGTYYAACHAWIRGADGKKVFGPWSELEAFEVTAMTPETPKITKVKVSGKTVTVTYTKCKNAIGYDIVMGTSVKKVNGELRPVDYGIRVKKITRGNTVTVNFRNCPKGTYYVGLHAYNRTSADKKKVFSPWSNSKKVTIR